MTYLITSREIILTLSGDERKLSDIILLHCDFKAKIGKLTKPIKDLAQLAQWSLRKTFKILNSLEYKRGLIKRTMESTRRCVTIYIAKTLNYFTPEIEDQHPHAGDEEEGGEDSNLCSSVHSGLHDRAQWTARNDIQIINSSQDLLSKNNNIHSDIFNTTNQQHQNPQEEQQVNKYEEAYRDKVTIQKSEYYPTPKSNQKKSIYQVGEIIDKLVNEDDKSDPINIRSGMATERPLEETQEQIVSKIYAKSGIPHSVIHKCVTKRIIDLFCMKMDIEKLTDFFLYYYDRTLNGNASGKVYSPSEYGMEVYISNVKAGSPWLDSKSTLKEKPKTVCKSMTREMATAHYFAVCKKLGRPQIGCSELGIKIGEKLIELVEQEEQALVNLKPFIFDLDESIGEIIYEYIQKLPENQQDTSSLFDYYQVSYTKEDY